MTKTLLIMRHAKSSWADPDRDDHDRPLNGRGKRDAKTMGRWLVARGLAPDVILSSSARRARKTARRMTRHASLSAPVHIDESLYHAGPAALRHAVAALPPPVTIALIVAHNPGIEDFLTDLTNADEPMPTGAIAWVEFTGVERWDAIANAGKLCAVWRPREIIF
ncbi:MAG: histidine phosphatase family protein [Phycisphaerales bacterium]|nr:histidine phosphatase family protein [Phycisphaerae bacterium]NNF42633.1 histidine phosphatase family protein [Phycisphaerales bacterium]NNM25028.1 histidine phosphatase family protein [Phycisphaerales bacterium]